MVSKYVCAECGRQSLIHGESVKERDAAKRQLQARCRGGVSSHESVVGYRAGVRE